MTKLPRLTGKELGKIIEKLGFKFDHQTGSHMVFKHSNGEKQQSIITVEKKLAHDF